MEKFNEEEIQDIAMSVTLEMCLEDKEGNTLMHNDTLIMDSGEEFKLHFDFYNLQMVVIFTHPNGMSILQPVNRCDLEMNYRKKK